MTTTLSFEGLGIVEQIHRALNQHNYTTPTPIQANSIPILLERKDLLGIAQTGTGKTAAFALPILQHLYHSKQALKPRMVRALILTSTRELVVQIAASFKKYGAHLSLRQATIYGGVSQHQQVRSIENGVDYLIATPGRLLDLVEQRHVDLSQVDYLVLDEADRMLDIGFIHDIRKIVKCIPQKRQTLLFSATMPENVSGLAKSILKNPEVVEVTPEAITVDKIDQSLYHVEKKDKRALLHTLLQNPDLSRVIVFSKTKHGANRIALDLEYSKVTTSVLHGNKSQAARQKALEDFKKGQSRVLVATDIAARGIDVRDISHVINYDLPNEPESYVHRIGRTARAGAQGIAYSFCDETERKLLRDIEKVIRFKLKQTVLPELAQDLPASPSKPKPPQRSGGKPANRGASNGTGRGSHSAGRSGGGRPSHSDNKAGEAGGELSGESRNGADRSTRRDFNGANHGQERRAPGSTGRSGPGCEPSSSAGRGRSGGFRGRDASSESTGENRGGTGRRASAGAGRNDSASRSDGATFKPQKKKSWPKKASSN